MARGVNLVLLFLLVFVSPPIFANKVDEEESCRRYAGGQVYPEKTTISEHAVHWSKAQSTWVLCLRPAKHVDFKFSGNKRIFPAFIVRIWELLCRKSAFKFQNVVLTLFSILKREIIVHNREMFADNCSSIIFFFFLRALRLMSLNVRSC